MPGGLSHQQGNTPAGAGVSRANHFLSLQVLAHPEQPPQEQPQDPFPLFRLRIPLTTMAHSTANITMAIIIVGAFIE